eukprot:CAMPEP_0114292210 /NCGR_PEP_ID=MMETSP0059-20121206/8934_1 /TAXON_ID=36894 /ORGANISM="Pyramimonas parkeae, Strain CCMP726" /LENGTH=695 /DNA_ID=CAMNT_0001413831 /DNA_START=81 /DNA_END=2165 /DNA_ORIENTATION=+
MSVSTRGVQRLLCGVLVLVTVAQIIYLNMNVLMDALRAENSHGVNEQSGVASWARTHRAALLRRVNPNAHGKVVQHSENLVKGETKHETSERRSSSEPSEPQHQESYPGSRPGTSVTVTRGGAAATNQAPARGQTSDASGARSASEERASAQWRLRTCSKMYLWDVYTVSFTRNKSILQPKAAIASGSASDKVHGGAPGFEAANAVLRQDRLWGGRPDSAGEMYIGAQFAQPQVVDCAFVRQNNIDEHVSTCLYMERLDEDGTWKTESHLYDIDPEAETIICAKWVPQEEGAKPTHGVASLPEAESKELSGTDPNGTKVFLYRERDCQGEHMLLTSPLVRMCEMTRWPDGGPVALAKNAMSMRVVGAGEVDLYEDCSGHKYWSSVLPLDGCTDLYYSWPPTNSLRIQPVSHLATVQSPAVAWNEGRELVRGPPAANRTFRVVYSGESSEYHGFQTQASLYSFMDSNQGAHGGMWTRLLTASEPDDVSDVFPTFYAKRHPYSKRYSPLNKADVTQKWFASASAPGPDEVIVMIDPDNWLLQPIDHIAAQVKPGHAIAEAAWFSGQGGMVRKLWNLFCRANCQSARLDLAAVPYFVHSQDLAKIGPLWKEYVLLMKYKMDQDGTLASTFRSLQFDWCVEMYGYVFAAAELGIKHQIMTKLQVRDVDNPPPRDKEHEIPMIHMGRAWLPNDYEPGNVW